MISSYLIPFDAFERNKKVASFLKEGEEVLDVGGGITGIKFFTKNSVKTLDIGEADITADARSLTLASGSVRVVTCVDVLEHIPPKERSSFVKNLYRIAKSRLIIAAPYGSKEHEEAEKKLLSEITKRGKKVPFLEEHVKYGLPTPSDWVPGGKPKVFYAGDYRFSNLLFKLQIWETGNWAIDRVLLLVKGAVNILANLLLYPFWFYQRPSQYSNRFYVLLEK
jgi:hypothetical protein